MSIERVVVSLDAASENLIAIETAARLAAQAGAKLHGIFVEDEELLHLASLPFSRQFTLGAATEALTTEHVELHLRIAAERARGELLAAAERHSVTGSFEILRGRPESALVGAAEGDLVVAGALTRPIARHFRVECRWWSSLEAPPGQFLLARHAWSAGGAVVMLLDDRSAASSRLLAAAAQIARSADSVLTVICPPETAGTGFETWIADRLADRPVRLQIEAAPAAPAALRQRIDELDCRLLAIEAGGVALRDLVGRYACDILIVR